MIAGQTDPVQLADPARGTLKNKRAALVEARTGRITLRQRRLIKLHLDLIERLEAAVAEIDAHLGEALAPFHDAVARIDRLPGTDRVGAQGIAIFSPPQLLNATKTD